MSKAGVNRRTGLVVSLVLLLSLFAWLTFQRSDSDLRPSSKVEGRDESPPFTEAPAVPPPSMRGSKDENSAPQGDRPKSIRTEPSADEVQQAKRKQHREELRRTAQSFYWEGGGVEGSTEAQLHRDLSNLFRHVVLPHERDLHRAVDEIKGHVVNTNDDATHNHTELMGRLEGLFVLLARNLTGQRAEDADCMMHLTPQQRGMCLLYAAMDEPQGGSEERSLFERRVFLESYCSAMVPCLLWGRGRFSQRLTPELLERVYEERVVRSVVANEARANAARSIVRNFVHSDENTEENRWLWRRTSAMEAFLSKHHSLVSMDERKHREEQRGVREVGRGWNRNERDKLVWCHSLNAVRDVFQGRFVGYDFDRRCLVTEPLPKAPLTEEEMDAVPRGEEPPPLEQLLALPPMSPLEAISVLHHIVRTGHASRKQYPLGSQDTIGDEKRFHPNLNLIVFGGDSMNREVFMRLTHWIRFGLGPRSSNPNLSANRFQRQAPLFEPSQQHDMVYAIYDDHDELRMFHTARTNAKSGHTVAAFFQKLRWAVRRHEAWKAGLIDVAHPAPKIALVYVVYHWDHLTHAYRKDWMVSDNYLDQTVEQLAEVLPVASEPWKRKEYRLLLESGAILPAFFPSPPSPSKLLIGDAARRARAAEAQDGIAAVNPENPCEVIVRLPDGSRRGFDLSRRRMSGLMIREMGRFNDNGCNQAKKHLVEAIRRHTLRQHHYQNAIRPTPPLREMGMKIAMFVQGQLFWDSVRSEEQLQSLFAFLSTVESETPSSPSIPRRSVPKDNTRVYLMTATFVDPLQPGRRKLHPLFQPRTLVPPNASLWNSEESAEEGDPRLFNQWKRSQSPRSSESVNASSSETTDLTTVIVPGIDEDLPENETEFLAELGLLENQTSAEQEAALLSNLSFSNATEGTDGFGDERQHGGGILTPPKWHVHPLRNFPVVALTRDNLIKNMHHFLWFQELLKVRRRRVQDPSSWEHPPQLANPPQAVSSSRNTESSSDALKQAQPQYAATPFRYASKAHLLDMAKLQFLRFRQGDDRHFSCRFAQVMDVVRFHNTLDPFSIRHLLTPGVPSTLTESIGMFGSSTTPSPFASPGAASSTKASSSGATTEDVVQLMVRLSLPLEVREALYQISGMEEIERLPPHSLMALLGKREYGVLMYDDGARCVDDANLAVLNILLMHTVLEELGTL